MSSSVETLGVMNEMNENVKTQHFLCFSLMMNQIKIAASANAQKS